MKKPQGLTTRIALLSQKFQNLKRSPRHYSCFEKYRPLGAGKILLLPESHNLYCYSQYTCSHKLERKSPGQAYLILAWHYGILRDSPLGVISLYLNTLEAEYSFPREFPVQAEGQGKTFPHAHEKRVPLEGSIYIISAAGYIYITGSADDNRKAFCHSPHSFPLGGKASFCISCYHREHHSLETSA